MSESQKREYSIFDDDEMSKQIDDREKGNIKTTFEFCLAAGITKREYINLMVNIDRILKRIGEGGNGG